MNVSLVGETFWGPPSSPTIDEEMMMVLLLLLACHSVCFITAAFNEGRRNSSNSYFNNDVDDDDGCKISAMTHILGQLQGGGREGQTGRQDMAASHALKGYNIFICRSACNPNVMVLRNPPSCLHHPPSVRS